MDIQNYNNIFTYLTNPQQLSNLPVQQQQQIQKQSKNFQVQCELLYKIQPKTQKLLRVVRNFELDPVLYMFHNDPTAAHASKDKMFDKIKERYYWPQMFEDIKNYVITCDTCQRRGKAKRNEPLHPIPVGEPFFQIGIDYVGPLPRTKNGNRYIIVAMDYLTKWPEAKPVKEATAKETVQFVYEDIICRHGCPGKILTDRGTHFNNLLLKGLMKKFEIQHLMSTPYHPQTNGLVERFNRTLGEALAKSATENIEEWDQYIAPVLFAYRTSKHATTRMTPFFLVHGREAKLVADSSKMEEETHLAEHVESQLNNLPIARHNVKQQINDEQQIQKERYDDKHQKSIQYKKGDLVLYYKALLDNRHTGKLEPKWKGPYIIHQVIGNGAYKLGNLEGQVLKTPVNGMYLKIYNQHEK